MRGGVLQKGLVVSGLVGVLLAGPAVAADKDGRFAVEGGGVQPCSDFLAAAEKKGERFSYYLGWMQGYMTGLNRSEPDTFDLTPWQDGRLMALALRTFCKKQPETLLAHAVEYVALAMRDLRLRSAAPTVQAGAGRDAITLYAPVVKEIEQRLADLGYFRRTPDESFDGDTGIALRAFQRETGIEVTGRPDQTTLYALFSARKD
ncbi:MAG: peptidoglycan-binding protein [Rhodothalassiaceae bacterium]